MKDWMKNWWNPIWYLKAIWQTFTSVIGGIFTALGFSFGSGQPQHENIQPEDVDRAYNDTAAAEALPPTFGRDIDNRVHEFVRYIESSPEERAAFDLSVFDTQQQDFILGLKDEDIEELRRSGPVGQITAALIGRIPPGVEMETAPVAKPEPSKAEIIRGAFLSRVRGRAEDTSYDGLDFAPMAIR
ncbi:hypothetical protein CN128_07490 [Sinorhizobium meliloti]|uniref:hypothetical protein n=1 Tax=Rhizobium meliloti TaxID=382 RepID=UPI000FD6E309|nr:hypothetical protein [Sinorhizobium meliloti]RVM58883.1 hypothetical protein CN128_07490 [Sinorhizobium meliloti]